MPKSVLNKRSHTVDKLDILITTENMQQGTDNNRRLNESDLDSGNLEIKLAKISKQISFTDPEFDFNNCR